MRILAYVLISLLMISNAFAQSGSRRIQSGDVTGALGYTPLRSIGAMIGPDILCGTGLNCTSNTISGIAAGTSGQIQYNNSGSLGGFTLNGDATVNTGTGAIALANVNSNVGSFGSATNCVSFTTNAKGLITAASNVICTPNIALVSGLGTGVATALAINTGSAGAPVLFNGALGTPSSGVGTNLTALNASNLSSGTVAAARMPALTGDCTTSAGAVATTCTSTGGVAFNYGAVTTTTSLTISSGSGTITTSSAALRYQVRGKLTWFQLSVTITTNGTGATNVSVNGLPFTFNSDCTGSGRATAGSGKQLQFFTQAATTGLTIVNYDNTYPATSGEILKITGYCETT